MKTYVEETAPATREYVRFLFETFMAKWPLRKKEIVSVSITEGSPNFPRIVEMPENYPDGHYISKEIPEDRRRNGDKMVAILNFTTKILWNKVAVLIPAMYPGEHMKLEFDFVIYDPEALKEKAEQFGFKVGENARVNRLGTAPTSFNPEIILYLESNGDLWREPKNEYCYQMTENSDRYKIVRYLSEYKGYKPTVEIKNEVGMKDAHAVMDAIYKINENAEEFLELGKRNFIEGKRGSGYKINSKYPVRLRKG